MPTFTTWSSPTDRPLIRCLIATRTHLVAEIEELGRKIHTMGRYSEARNEMHQNVASIQRVSLPGFTRKNDTMNMRTIRREGA